MRTPVLVLPVKGQILRTWGEGKKWENFCGRPYGWPLVCKIPLLARATIGYLVYYFGC